MRGHDLASVHAAWVAAVHSIAGYRNPTLLPRRQCLLHEREFVPGDYLVHTP